MTPRAALLVLAPLLLADCHGRRDTWHLHYPRPLARQIKGVDGRPCDEMVSDRTCDPFVCVQKKCVVKECVEDRDCPRGICIEGYCALPPPQPGKRCDPFDDEGAHSILYPAKVEPRDVHDERVAKYLSQWDRCSCRPLWLREGMTSAESDECGPFPCTPSGCYVHACESDSDCAEGLCSSHASWPNDWCVKSDPH